MQGWSQCDDKQSQTGEQHNYASISDYNYRRAEGLSVRHEISRIEQYINVEANVDKAVEELSALAKDGQEAAGCVCHVGKTADRQSMVKQTIDK